uniref:Uncharacterized protein n=1 Tax=Anguilla anguilla TaxID=7936 RepID=A0A0E9PHY6_ANGAN
MSSFERRNRR